MKTKYPHPHSHHDISYANQSIKSDDTASIKKQHPTCGHDHTHPHGCDHEQHLHENHWFKAGLGLISGIALLILSLTGTVLSFPIYALITGFSSLLTLYLGQTIYRSSWKSLQQKQWNTSVLYAISTLTIFTLSLVSLFVPSLPVVLESAALILGFWHLGEGIEHSLLEEINAKLDVRDCAPSFVKRKGTQQMVRVTELCPGDIIEIPEDNTLPVNGQLIFPSTLDTPRIDGSPFPKKFPVGALVKAGMKLPKNSPPLVMTVTEAFDKSHLSLLAENVLHANDEKAPIELLTNKILRFFIPGLLAVSFVAGISISLLFNPLVAVQCVISVLVSACPCALSIITPLAVKIGMTKASENGVYFKNGKALQTMPEIDTLVFDLNGTLTKGDILVKLNINNSSFLNEVAHLEKMSDHPIGQRIYRFLSEKGYGSDELTSIHSVDESNHSGIKGVVNGIEFIIGDKNMLVSNGIHFINPPYDNPDNGLIYIVRAKKIIGQIDVTDPLRHDAIETIRALRNLGKTIHLCTGADADRAQRYTKQLGISNDNICSNAVGAAEGGKIAKVDYVKRLQKNGRKVAMVGDATNDLGALKASNLGIAVKSTLSDAITEEHAGILLQRGALLPIVTAFEVAHQTKKNIFQNLFVSLTYNSTITLVASGLFIGLGITLSPSLGVALMVLESTIILGNLGRFNRKAIQISTIIHPTMAKNFSDSQEVTASMLKKLGTQPQVNDRMDPMRVATHHPVSQSYGPLFHSAQKKVQKIKSDETEVKSISFDSQLDCKSL